MEFFFLALFIKLKLTHSLLCGSKRKKKVCVVVFVVDCCFALSRGLTTSKIANQHDATQQNTKNNKTEVRKALILLFLLYSFTSILHLSYIYSFIIIFINYHHCFVVFIIVVVFTVVFAVFRLVGRSTVHSARGWHCFSFNRFCFMCVAAPACSPIFKIFTCQFRNRLARRM